MLSEAEAINKLKSLISKKRLKHSLAVRDTAVKLAESYPKLEINEVRWAALLHDCAKGFSQDKLLQKTEEFGIVIDSVERKVPALLHAVIGAEVAKREFGVTDQSILQAIRYHTVGNPQMTTLDKIIFLADYIEPNRDCTKIAQLRDKIDQISLNEAVKTACENTIIYNLNENRIIDPKTIETRNALI